MAVCNILAEMNRSTNNGKFDLYYENQIINSKKNVSQMKYALMSNSPLKAMKNHNTSYDIQKKDTNSKISANDLISQSIYSVKLPSNIMKTMVKTKRQSMKKGLEPINQRESLVEQTLRPYKVSQSPQKEHKSLAKWNRQKKEEINDSIGSILKQEYFNQTSPNKQMDLFVPHRTEANFKPKPKTNTLSSIKSSRPPRKERVLTSLRFPENKEVEVKIHDTPPQSGRKEYYPKIPRHLLISIDKVMNMHLLMIANMNFVTKNTCPIIFKLK